MQNRQSIIYDMATAIISVSIDRCFPDIIPYDIAKEMAEAALNRSAVDIALLVKQEDEALFEKKEN